MRRQDSKIITVIDLYYGCVVCYFANKGTKQMTTSFNDIKLGYMYRDRLSGFTGTAAAIIEMLGGTVQVSLVKNKPDCDKPEDWHAFDYQTLEPVQTDEPFECIPPEPQVFKLGHRVKDVISGVVGVAKTRLTYMNGCVFYTIEGPTVDGKDTNVRRTNCQFIDFVDAGLVGRTPVRPPGDEDASAAPAVDDKNRRGGPPSRMSDFGM